jgi:hypothetical protein
MGIEVNPPIIRDEHGPGLHVALVMSSVAAGRSGVVEAAQAARVKTSAAVIVFMETLSLSTTNPPGASKLGGLSSVRSTVCVAVQAAVREQPDSGAHGEGAKRETHRVLLGAVLPGLATP